MGAPRKQNTVNCYHSLTYFLEIRVDKLQGKSSVHISKGANHGTQQFGAPSPTFDTRCAPVDLSHAEQLQINLQLLDRDDVDLRLLR